MVAAMSRFTILHNPRCSKSRETLRLLREKDIEPEVIEYLSAPPSKKQFAKILDMLDMKPRQVMRTREAEYREHGLDNSGLSDSQLIELMLAHPKVIERPIVFTDQKAVIGRPPENVLELLA